MYKELLYNNKLIYKDKKLVNWDTQLQTAISDLEVIQKDVQSQLYYIDYQIENSDNKITIATTRPETMMGDTAVAVNPKDERYINLIGKNVEIPLVNRKVKIIADHYADPEQGSGAVKITPAHDFNDYEVGKRNKLELINIFEKNGKINNNGIKKFVGLDRFEARKLLVKQLKENGNLVKIEAIKNKVPYGDRSNTIIEPLLTEQWFVDAKKLSKKPISIINEGKTTFFPSNWTKTFFQWMKNIEPWCISRQIWWGHRIPAWYDEDNNIFVAENENDALILAKKKNKNKKVKLKQETDVLDTWFSSALWPFATLGWPAKTKELSKFYPTSVLVTGFDIIFFWVARMLMMGNYFNKHTPFHKIYVHALVRDEKGQKMSKSKGNVIDPLELINEFGADSLRFTLISMASPGRDVKLSKDRVIGNRNFITKIWSANNFLKLNNCKLNKKVMHSRAWTHGLACAVMSNQTQIEGVELLSPGKHIEIKIQKKMFSSAYLLETKNIVKSTNLKQAFAIQFENYPLAIRDAATRMAQSTLSLLDIDDVMIKFGLSGGLDSRVILAAVLQKPELLDKISISTNASLPFLLESKNVDAKGTSILEKEGFIIDPDGIRAMSYRL